MTIEAEEYAESRKREMTAMQEIARKYFARILEIYPDAALNLSPVIKVWKVTAGRDEFDNSNLLEIDIAEDGCIDVVSNRYKDLAKRREAKNIMEAWGLALKEIY